MKLFYAALTSQLTLGALAAAGAQSLQAWNYSPLPVGSVKPAGWLRGEMQAMADGLAGHEHDFYVYVNESRWLFGPSGGGTDYSNLNEGLPYWFNGLVPMAYVLDDSRLKGQVHAVASTVLSLQTADGWIGPETYADRNFWARTPFFLGLTQLAEANSTWEQPVLDALRKFMDLTNTMLKNNSQGFTNCDSSIDCRWGQARVHDLIITIQWLIENHPSNQDSTLWENMNMFYSQDQFKWDEWYTASTYPKVIANPSSAAPDFPYMHGVNVGQGLKASAVMYRFSNNETFIQKSMDAVDWTFQYHGAPSGTVLADEIQHNLAPYMGSELCTAVETAYSLIYMYQVLGNNMFADRAELTIFNAMPVMLTGNKWARQYMDQPNQPWGVNNTQDFVANVPHVFTTANTGVATTFGMEPVYPCCTVNHPQGYPKFTTNSWVRVGDNGLAHALLSPSTVTTTVAGSEVSIDCDTTYPFGNTLTYTVIAKKDFDFYVRVPSWIKTASSKLRVNGASSSPSPNSNGLHLVAIKAGKTTVEYTIDAALRTESRSNNTIAVYYGNVLYALDVGFQETSSYPHAYYDATGPGLDYLPYPELRDYYISNTSAWNVAIDPSTLKYHGMGKDTTLANPIFAQAAPPNFVTVQGCMVNWDLYLGATPEWAPTDTTCLGGKQEYKLRPYGAVKVHMSEMPIVKL